MQIGVLGPLTVEDSGRPVPVGGARLRGLLVRLAADPGRWVGAGALSDALWADEPPADQANALQSLVSRLRRALPDELIESGPAGYRLAISPDDVDAFRFEAALARARPDGVAIRAALSLWRGPALVDVPDLPFATAWAARLEELRLGAVEDAVEAALTGGLDRNAADVVLELEAVLAAQPLRERPHGQLIRVLAATGRAAEALAVYAQLRARLADELGVDPGPDLQALHLALLRGEPLPGAVTPAPPRRRRRTNLRPALTSFVGREDDVRGLRELLRASRLITLTGAGGSGKTRLSMEAALGLDGLEGPGGPGADGVWQAQLAPVTDPGDLAMTALGALGLRDHTVVDNRQQQGHRDPLNRLVEAIDDHDVVLLLDNCEHVIEAAAELAETLLGRCPRLRVLATSREPLGISGEALWPVRPLPTAGEAEALPAALQLFADRAALVRPGFRLDESNRETIAEICRRLDGLPLAIELAAARLRTLSVPTIAQRLSDRFRLLTGGSRTALPRHQTLRAVVAWSWDLLTGPERLLAEQLSIFPGGASPAAAEALPDVGAQAPELLDALADKSLLVVVDGTEPRYRMLETIREFGAERLAERGELPAARAAFGAFFLALVEQTEPQLRGAAQVHGIDRLDLEHDNILAALRYATDADDAGTAVRIGAGMSWYWTLLGLHEEASGWLEPVLRLPGEKPLEPYVLASMGYLLTAAATAGRMPDPDAVAEVASLAARLDPATAHPLIALVEPAIAMIDDDAAGVQAAVARSLSHPDPWTRAMLRQLAVVSAENAGDLDTVRAVLPAALQGFRELGDRWGLATALGAQANLDSLDGDDPAAIACLDEARELMRQLRARDDEAYTSVRAALLRARAGDIDGARLEIDRALELALESGSPHSEAFAHLASAQLARITGDRAEAWSRLTSALRLLADGPPGMPQLKALTHTVQLQLHVLDGELERARALVPVLIAAVEDSHDMPIGGIVADAEARLALAWGDAGRAAELIGAGISLRGGGDLGDPEVAQLIVELEQRLGPSAFRAARSRGEQLSQPQALALMRSLAG